MSANVGFGKKGLLKSPICRIFNNKLLRYKHFKRAMGCTYQTLISNLKHTRCQIKHSQTSNDCSLWLSLPLGSVSRLPSSLAPRTLLLVGGCASWLSPWMITFPSSGVRSGTFIISFSSSSTSSGERVDSRLSRSGSSLTWRPVRVRPLIFLLDMVSSGSLGFKGWSSGGEQGDSLWRCWWG